MNALQAVARRVGLEKTDNYYPVILPDGAPSSNLIDFSRTTDWLALKLTKLGTEAGLIVKARARIVRDCKSSFSYWVNNAVITGAIQCAGEYPNQSDTSGTLKVDEYYRKFFELSRDRRLQFYQIGTIDQQWYRFFGPDNVFSHMASKVPQIGKDIDSAIDELIERYGGK